MVSWVFWTYIYKLGSALNYMVLSRLTILSWLVSLLFHIHLHYSAGGSLLLRARAAHVELNPPNRQKTKTHQKPKRQKTKTHQKSKQRGGIPPGAPEVRAKPISKKVIKKAFSPSSKCGIHAGSMHHSNQLPNDMARCASHKSSSRPLTMQVNGSGSQWGTDDVQSDN